MSEAYPNVVPGVILVHQLRKITRKHGAEKLVFTYCNMQYNCSSSHRIEGERSVPSVAVPIGTSLAIRDSGGEELLKDTIMIILPKTVLHPLTSIAVLDDT